MFTKRLISALVLLAVMGTALAVGGTLLLCLSVITALLGSFELLRVDHMQKSVPGCMSYISVIGFYLLLFWQRGDFVEFWVAATAVLMLSAYVVTYPKHHIKEIALCLFAVIYVGVLMSYLYQTRCLVYGNWFVWLILISASGSDTLAYLTGSLIGKHHFSELSPKKTIEGCVGGMVGAALLAGIYSLFLPEGAARMFDINVQLAFVGIGAMGSVVSQFGDLAASAVKRNYGVKDYSDLIPGHGGVLDRIDSILFVSPLVYYMLYWFVI